MNNPAAEDIFQQYESQYVSDLDGRLIRVEEATRNDLGLRFSVTIDGQVVKDVPKAVPATDDQGNIKRDEEGLVVPRLTTVYDAVRWRYRDTDANFPGPDPKNPVPVLCHQNHQTPVGVCRVCSVLTEKGGRVGEKLIPACQHPLVNGMQVHTVASTVPVKAPGERNPVPAGQYLERTVTVLLQLLAANYLHRDEDLPEREGRYRNELRALLERFTPEQGAGNGLKLRPRPYDKGRVDDSSEVIRVDHNNCILCDRCVRGCGEVKPWKVIGHTGFGNKARVSFDLGQPMGDSSCVSCGECAASCPTGALTFKGSIYEKKEKDTKRGPWHDEPLRPATVAADELEKMPLFAGVSYGFLKWNEGSVGRVNAPPGQLLCKQGDYGSTAFLIESGAIDVVVGERVVFTCPAEEVIVGELACLNHQPRKATLKAGKGGASILVVKRNMLHMLQRNAGARNLLAPIYRRRGLDNYLQQGQLFAGLEPAQSKACIDFLKASKDVTLTQVDPGQAVFQEGNRADAFYIVYLGHVSVTETNAQGHAAVRDYMGSGRQFGEIGLLSDPEVSPTVAALLPAERQGRRTATCTALDHVEIVSISRKAFLDLLTAHPDVRERLEQKACEILERDRKRRNEVGHLLGDFTRAGLYQGQNLLVLDLNRCTRCQECVKACAESHQGVTRLILEGNRFGEYLVPSACRSCHDPACLVGCPVDAIHRKATPQKLGGKQSLAIVIEDHCIGCGLCSHNCPFGSIHMYDQPEGRRKAGTGGRLATNCDLCESLDGNPRCVHHCPHDAAQRMTGFKLAQRVGLHPLGSARDADRG
jgi:Fe-S-cluster-containing hydrogenase component 2/CRP-like cAMP-binding protein